MAGTTTYYVCDYTGVSYANGASDTLAWDNGSRMSPHTFNITGTKTVNGNTTFYLHDGTREIAEYDNGGTLAARHVFSGDDQVLATIRGTDYLYYHKDIQGSVVALTDAARNLRGQVTYSPYGESGNIAPAANMPGTPVAVAL